MDKIDKIMKNYLWEEIHGFSYPSQYSKFIKFLEKQIASGNGATPKFPKEYAWLFEGKK